MRFGRSQLNEGHFKCYVDTTNFNDHNQYMELVSEFVIIEEILLLCRVCFAFRKPPAHEAEAVTPLEALPWIHQLHI